MDLRISQQTREDAAQSLRQWATARDVPLLQIEQMVAAILSGQHDATILRARVPVQSAQQQQQQQQHTFVPQMPAFDFQSMFGNFPMPPMPVPPIIPPPLMNSPPAAFVPSMFPNTDLASAPNVHATRTIFPGGEAFQQSSSYSGQQGNRNFQYSASSTSMAYTPSPGIPMPARPFPPLLHQQRLQQPLFPAIPLPQPAPLYEPLPIHPPALEQQLQRHPPSPVQPEAQDAPLVADDASSPKPLYHPLVPNLEPQNARLAETFRQQLGEANGAGENGEATKVDDASEVFGAEVKGKSALQEATYFSDIPGMPDRGVQQ